MIRFSSLGDCVLLCPLIEALDAAGSNVTVVTKRPYLEIFAATRGAGRVVALDEGAGTAGLYRLAQGLRGHGGVVIDAHNTMRSRLLSGWLGGAHTRLRKYYRERMGLIVFKHDTPMPTVLQNYRQLALDVGVDIDPLRPGGIVVPGEAAAWASSHLAGERRRVAMAPGSRWPAKRWGAGKFLDIAQRLAESNFDVILVGDDHDHAVCAPIAAALGERALDMSGSSRLLQTAACIELCEAFVGNDSGLMHLAEAVGTPVVGIFGPTVETFGYFPALANSRAIGRSLACRPCSRNGATPCPKGTNECLDISVAQVESALDGMLSSPSMEMPT